MHPTLPQFVLRPNRGIAPNEDGRLPFGSRPHVQPFETDRLSRDDAVGREVIAKQMLAQAEE